jgi:hypothetical protein
MLLFFSIVALKGLDNTARSNAPGGKNAINTPPSPSPHPSVSMGAGRVRGLKIRDLFNPGAMPRVIIYSPFRARTKMPFAYIGATLLV